MIHPYLLCNKTTPWYKDLDMFAPYVGQKLTSELKWNSCLSFYYKNINPKCRYICIKENILIDRNSVL